MRVPVLQVLRLKLKVLRRFKKILRGHASACPCVLEALWLGDGCSVVKLIQCTLVYYKGLGCSKGHVRKV